MTKKNKPRVNFLNAFSPRKELLGLLATPENSEGTEYTRFYTWLNGNWGILHFDLDLTALTQFVDESKSYKAWWMIGKRGEVIEVVKGNPTIHQIKTAGTGVGKYGYIEDLKVIGNSLFICGVRRQVYQYIDNNWQLISQNIMPSDGDKYTDFEAIDGINENCLYAVGSDGTIFHFDGANWIQLDSPTNVHFSDVCCVDKNNIWVCGDNGIVLHGSQQQWHVISDDNDLTENWWAIEEYNGDIYIAGDDVLGIIVDGVIEEVDIGKKISTGRLHSNDGRLWSVGESDIFVFDGQTWTEIVCPDNV